MKIRAHEVCGEYLLPKEFEKGVDFHIQDVVRTRASRVVHAAAMLQLFKSKVSHLKSLKIPKVRGFLRQNIVLQCDGTLFGVCDATLVWICVSSSG